MGQCVGQWLLYGKGPALARQNRKNRGKIAERPARLRLALPLLKGFLNWAAAEGHELDSGVILSRKAREIAEPPGVKDVALERGKLPTWFPAVKAITNPGG